MNLRTGFLAFVEHTGVRASGSAGLRAGMALFCAAEELGYDTGWVRVRHLENYRRCRSWPRSGSTPNASA
ncbi:MAG: hypothetical protein H7Y15_00450 [Pseudonocardia sp.]|nr:hypothetical protein [Pseudonocardia sp.]